ncbi:MAG: DUF4398 domain-containing protein [Treponema sp.]|nr:DUF4398 domain-containing protein [Treponema sp.]
MKIRLIYIVCIMLVLVLGCAKPPIAEMDNAREAVFRALNDPDAALHSSSTLDRAMDTLSRMQDEADNKRYDAAKTYAAEAVALADKAIADGRLAASRTRSDSGTLVTDLRTAIEDTQRNVNGARYSQLALDYDALDRDIIRAHEGADRVETSQADGKHQEAIDIARGVRADLVRINDRVAGAASARKK